MSNEQILENLIQNYQNDIQSGLQGMVSEEKYRAICRTYSELIIEFTRFIHNIRYCSRKDCACSPEYSIKKHVKKLNGYLNVKHALFQISSKWILEAIE